MQSIIITMQSENKINWSTRREKVIGENGKHSNELIEPKANFHSGENISERASITY